MPFKASIYLLIHWKYFQGLQTFWIFTLSIKNSASWVGNASKMLSFKYTIISTWTVIFWKCWEIYSAKFYFLLDMNIRSFWMNWVSCMFHDIHLNFIVWFIAASAITYTDLFTYFIYFQLKRSNGKLLRSKPTVGRTLYTLFTKYAFVLYSLKFASVRREAKKKTFKNPMRALIIPSKQLRYCWNKKTEKLYIAQESWSVKQNVNVNRKRITSKQTSSEKSLYQKQAHKSLFVLQHNTKQQLKIKSETFEYGNVPGICVFQCDFSVYRNWLSGRFASFISVHKSCKLVVYLSFGTRKFSARFIISYERING